jgi:EmrB/QacA subfamily drug resistance transporter
VLDNQGRDGKYTPTVPVPALLSSRRKTATAVVVCLGMAMLFLDTAVVNTALPSIARDLHADLSGLQWVVDAYTLVLAATVLSAGSIGDRRGRRHLFAIGMVVFTVSSLASALAPDIGFLDGARAAQGLGSAMMLTTGLAILADAFPAAERAKAMAAYGATIGAAYALGPAVGGALTSWLGWRSVFYVNIPLGVLALAGTYAWLRESRDPRARRLDWPGQLALCGGLFLLVLALLRGNDEGWGSTPIIAELAGAGVLLVAFVIAESSTATPMLPLRMFARRDFSAAQAVSLAISAGFFALYLYLTLYLQNVLGLSPLRAGAALLPGTILLFLVSARSAKLANRFSLGLLLTSALVLVAVGVALISVVGLHSSWTVMLPGFLLACVGTGIVNPASAILGMSAGPPEDSGLLAGVMNTFRYAGIAIGVAVFGTLLPAGATDGLGSPSAFLTGFHHALLVGSAISLAGAVAVPLLIGTRRARTDAPSVDADEPAGIPAGRGAGEGGQAA